MTNWGPLRTELAIWQSEGRALPFWWRDDDATRDTAALRQMAGMARASGLPVHIAVIPVGVEDSLAARVADTPELIPLVHGWRHTNNAVPFSFRAEFGADRPLPVMEADLIRAREHLERVFPGRLAPVFVPPWNRIAPRLRPLLGRSGYSAISTYKARKTPSVAPGVQVINTHIDPIDWHGNRSLLETDALLSVIVERLAARRTGLADPEEPFGLLTHHLVHDDAIWAFCEQLIDIFLSGPATRWSFTQTAQPET